jgi:hypothetical protein
MNQFVQIQGASSQETFWFSRACNAVAGQIDHIRRTTKLLQSAASKGLNGQKPIAAPFSLHIIAVLTPFRPCL